MMRCAALNSRILGQMPGELGHSLKTLFVAVLLNSVLVLSKSLLCLHQSRLVDAGFFLRAAVTSSERGRWWSSPEIVSVRFCEARSACIS